ncbi:Polyketide cyclase / dehydrase and lipid transport protein [Quillaja saponaria]|uniref:Polyketide cyclase / dehydrase and lipid transport protein n=1 Tax=Quillaja saponaria TaxID=32244 RepID=A0AAD7VEZ3_QUISA|nr:Polyketide cyclase / dehydrase and lipid transport protein [Quillaja saponaria]
MNKAQPIPLLTSYSKTRIRIRFWREREITQYALLTVIASCVAGVTNSMRAFLVSSESYSTPLFFHSASSTSTSITNLSLLLLHPSKTTTYSLPHQPFSTTTLPKLWPPQIRPYLYCTSKSDSTLLGVDEDDDDVNSVDVYDVDFYDDDDGGYLLVDDEGGELQSIAEDGVYIAIKKLGNNSRRIRSKISIEAPLNVVWSILTDYEKLADFIPGLAVSKLLDKKDNYARLFQIGQQNLAFGLKFNAKGILDCYEKEMEILPVGKKRDIEFKMTEGDFQLFEGKWSIVQSSGGTCEEGDSSQTPETCTTLSYIVDVKPKLWLPVRLIEGRLCKEIKMNLASVRDEARKAIIKTVHAH